MLVHHDGGELAAPATLRIHRSVDAVICSADTELVTRDASFLPLEFRQGYAYRFTAPAVAGTYCYGACVDGIAGESSTTNNCSDAVSLRVADPGTPTALLNPVMAVGCRGMADGLYRPARSPKPPRRRFR